MATADGAQTADAEVAPTTASRWRARLAVLAAIMTFPLILAGGLVTSKDAGLSVPDWPSTFGHNMLTYPVSEMVKKEDVFVEHSHRLIGSLVGFLVLSLTLWTSFAEERPWLRRLTWIALVAVCLQGLLGGLRVVLVRNEFFGPWAIAFAIVHGCLAQLFFCLISSVALFHRAEWASAPVPLARSKAEGLARLAPVVPVILFAQLAVGAVFRHTGLLLSSHIGFAAVVVFAVVLLVRRTRAEAPELVSAQHSASFLISLLVLQVGLGLGAWVAVRDLLPIGRTRVFQELIPTLHAGVGALLLLNSVLLALRVRRSLAAAEGPADAVKVELPARGALEPAMAKGG